MPKMSEKQSSDPEPTNVVIWQVNDAGFKSALRMKIGLMVLKIWLLKNKIFSRNLVFQVGLWAFVGSVEREKFLDVLGVCIGACCDGRMLRNGG